MYSVQGWIRVSLLDYPDHLCSTLFIAGCNFRCPYCHNKDLINKNGSLEQIAWGEIVEWLDANRRMIDGVCFTGGEPTLCADLESMIDDIKRLNLKVKLDTNGTNPQMLKRLLGLKLLDFVAMDIKAPLRKYSMVCRTNVDLQNIKESVEIIKSSAPRYEFRTTFHPSLLSIEDFYQICEWLRGAPTYVIQNCRTGDNLDPFFSRLSPASYEDVQDIASLCRKYFANFSLRGFTNPLRKPVSSFHRV